MLSLIIASLLKKTFDIRYDGAPVFDFPPVEHFGAESSPFYFRSGDNLLRGDRVFLRNKAPYKAAVVFFHGAGAGATAYSLEIAALAKQGYLVYCYDGTGCMRSPGKVLGLNQGLLDQKAFFEFLDQDQASIGLSRFAIGHSWGGFLALAALQEGYHIEKTVSMSGFLSLSKMLQYHAKALQKREKPLKKALKHLFGVYGDFDILSLIEKSDKPIYYIQGEHDKMVPLELGYSLLKERFPNKENLKTLLVKRRAHNPYWTVEAERYYEDLIGKEKIMSPNRRWDLKVDNSKLNQDDPEVLKTIFDFLGR